MFCPLLLYFSASVKNREENAAGKVKALQMVLQRKRNSILFLKKPGNLLQGIF